MRKFIIGIVIFIMVAQALLIVTGIVFTLQGNVGFGLFIVLINSILLTMNFNTLKRKL